jgi:rhodanese-related sulfurtransferase
VFTGDTLFVGDVGRPDLVQKLKAEITPQYLAGLLYDSLKTKIMTLADDVIVYPGHGAGSACGKKMDKETFSTIGHQKKFNYALRSDLSRSEFIREVLRGLTEPPQYFPQNVLMNIKGYAPIDEVIRKGTTSLTPGQFKKLMEARNALVIDTRSKEDFPKAHIPGSIFIGIDDSFAPWVGCLIEDLRKPILIVADEGREEEVVTRLARVGYDHALGFLKGGVEAWKIAGYQTESLQEVTAEYFAKLYGAMINNNLLDVRRKDEYDIEHIAGAENFPLEDMNAKMTQLDNFKTLYVHCAGGYRSVIAASLLQARGFKHVINIQGGYKTLRNTFLDRTNVGIA